MDIEKKVESGEVLSSSSEVENQTINDDDPKVTIKVENYIPDDLQTYYSDGLTVLHTENEFIISFLQTEYPLAGTKEELQKIEALKSKCVSRIIVSPQQMEKLIRALQENFGKFSDSYKIPIGEK